MIDAIVIGSGPNGLVAANMLAARGWSVVVLEAAPEPGGAVRSSELIEPGFTNDHCSAFYPLGAGSPAMKALELDKYGLEWCRSPLVLAHPTIDGTCPVISRDIDETAASLGGADGDAWKRMYELWQVKGDHILGALFTPFPPVRAGLRMANGLEWRELLRLARFAVLPVRRMGDEQFENASGKRLLAGLALHADLLPESQLSGFFGWLLGCLGQDVGFPSPKGGAGSLTAALVRRLQVFDGALRCNARVIGIEVRGGKAVGVKLEGGEVISARRAVVADVDAPNLYLNLLPSNSVPGDVLADIQRFEWDSGTVKVDWNLDGPIPWSSPDARRSGTIHVADSVDELSVTASELARELVPTNPFLLLGQQSMVDPSRQPDGKETAWAYTHVPRRVRGDNGGGITGSWTSSESEQFADRMQHRIEALAPGFSGLVRARRVTTPSDFGRENSNLSHGSLGGGTAQLHQQLVFRPGPGPGRPETPVRGLFLASSSAHPGAGVHGAAGANAAQAALHGFATRSFVRAVRWAGKRQGGNKAQIVP